MIIQTIFKFIKGIFGPKKKEYILKFKNEHPRWYIDMPWSGDHDDLQMVGGADKLLAHLDPNEVTISCIPSSKNQEISEYFKLERTVWGWTKGAFYKVHDLEGFKREIWICPVTLCVLGYYPKYIYIKQL